MIVSASRRTDVPLLYGRWLLERLEAGFADVASPFDAKRVRRVDLRPAPGGSMEALVLWTRNPRPLLPAVLRWEEQSVRSVWLVTLTGYPKQLEPQTPAPDSVIQAVKILSNALGSDRVVWRYDPLLLLETGAVTADWHRRNFAALAGALRGVTRRCIVSLYDDYRKSERRLAAQGFKALPKPEAAGPAIPLLADLAELAHQVGIELQSCCEELQSAGIAPGACIDGDQLNDLWGLDLRGARDSGQRKACRCAPSVDIGAYDTCTQGCLYCYATASPHRASERFAAHTPDGERLV